MRAIRFFRLAVLIFLIAMTLALAVRSVASPGTTTRVSVDSAGNQGNGDGGSPAISADGRYVAFDSWASNLVANDTNGVRDIFLHDRQTAATERVSVDSSGNQANGNSSYWGLGLSMSDDARYVAFYSTATNLVPGDTNGAVDIFVRDRNAGTTVRVSVDSGGNQANGESWDPTISADGRYMAFKSRATNLVDADSNGAWDVFVHDRDTDGDSVFDEPGAIATERVSVDSAGGQGNADSFRPAVSAGGRYVAFRSSATNLVPGDTNGQPDVFVHDRQTGVTERVSVDSAGNQGNNSSGDGWVPPAITADGRYVAFDSWASNLVPNDTNGVRDIFLHDRQTGATERVSVASNGNQASGESNVPALNPDARYVAFHSWATNLAAGDNNNVSDVFVRDRWEGTTERVSVDTSGNQGNGDSANAAISGDGRYVAFWSAASNLVPGDTNGVGEAFVHDRGDAPTPTPAPVGGIAELPDVSRSSAPNHVALAGLAAATLLALTAGAWCARRRRLS